MEIENHKDRAHKEIDLIFRTLFPQNGLTQREEQIHLCHAILDALFQNRTLLCDAGVGLGKTYAYLTVCIIYKKYTLGIHTAVLSTSNVALQEAILKEYVPFLSRILLENHIVSEPLRTVIRKGKERFVCDIRLSERLEAVREKKKNLKQLEALRSLKHCFDLDSVSCLSNFDRKQVCVPKICSKTCSKYGLCRYHQYLRKAKKDDVFLQICNHNYWIADGIHTMQKQNSLLKEYQVLIIDEAHKLPETWRQMARKRLCAEEIEELCYVLLQKGMGLEAKQLREVFHKLWNTVQQEYISMEIQKVQFVLTTDRKAALQNCLVVLKKIKQRIRARMPPWVLLQMEEKENTLSVFCDTSHRYIRYVQYDQKGNPVLCADKKDFAEQMYQTLWQNLIPTVLTSGTLRIGNNFERIKQMTGLHHCHNVTEYTAESPFDYEKNCLLYLPHWKIHPQIGSKAELNYLANQIEQLIAATCGHTLVLFTSYVLMGNLYHRLKERITYPMFRIWKNEQRSIRQFKEITNGVLFAAGSCWEGIDFPGDLVSSLIIVRLPFPVPDPLSESEQEQYPTLQDYLKTVVIPDMQMKLRQGFGRAIRTETDTCVISILDCRAAFGQRYHEAALEALPPMPVTENVEDVEKFICTKKDAAYFIS